MKKTYFIMMCCIAVFLCACGNKQFEMSAYSESGIPSAQNEESTFKPTEGTTPKIVSIVDKTIGSGIDLAQSEEIFFEDEAYIYRFHSIMSHHIIVTYEDGSAENIAEALNGARASIADLDRFGIDYSAEEKHINPDLESITAQNESEFVIVNIVDETKALGLAVPDAVEVFYEDDLYQYTFSNIISNHIIVIYQDGSSETITDALLSGRASISALDRFGIEYFAEEKHINPDLQSIADQSTAEITKDEIELIYEDESFRYYLPDGLCETIVVTYIDGTSESIREALQSGRITVQDLDLYEISYTRIEKYMTVMQRDGKEDFELQEEARMIVEEILTRQEWENAEPRCLSDVILSTGVGYFNYHTDCGTFTHITSKTCCTVSEEERLQLLELFSQYIPINNK